jgi:hypothetical protein
MEMHTHFNRCQQESVSSYTAYFFSFLFLRDTYCLLEHDMYYKEATFLVISVKCFYRPRVLLIAGSTIMVYNTITCTWWKWTVVCGQLTKRMRGKMGSSKLYVHSNYAIRNNDKQNKVYLNQSFVAISS